MSWSSPLVTLDAAEKSPHASDVLRPAARAASGPVRARELLGALAKAALALLLLGLATTVPAGAQTSDGSVSGRVVNKTAGGGSTASATVTIVSFGRKEQAPVGQLTTQTDQDGRYSFSGLNRDPNFVYLVLARYQNVNYPTDQPFQLQDQPSYQTDITVYDATTADDAIRLERLNLLVVGADQGVVQCMEMGSLVNGGDRTFVTANPQDQALARAIKLALPNGALSVQMQTGFSDQDVIPAIGGIQVTSPVPPGSHQFALSFQLPYAGSSADVSMQLPYATGTYNVYLPDTGIKLDASGLTAAGPAQLGGQSYALYTASDVSRSTMMGAQLSGLGSTGGPGLNQVAFISLAVVLFVLGGGVLLFGARSRTGPPTSHGSPWAAAFEQERLELIVRLAALDERFGTGELRQAEYEAERDRGKQRLRELTLARRNAIPSGV